jgi:outer membrane protein assembly factor BamB
MRYQMPALSLLLTSLLLSGLTGCVVRPAPAPAPVAVAPKISDGLEDPARLLAKLWNKPGVFHDAYIAKLKGDHLYLAGAPRGIEAVDVNTGFTAWMHLGNLPLDVEPTVWKGAVYVAEGGEIVTVDEATGRALTRDTTRPGILTPLYPSEYHLIVGSPDERVYGVGIGTGLRQFRINIFGYPIGSTWNEDDLAFMTTSKGWLYGFSIPTRVIAWQYQFKKPFCTAPVLQDDMIYVGNQDYHLYAFEPVNGAFQWRAVLTGPVLAAPPVVTDDRVYASTTNGFIHAVDLETHKSLWRVPGHQVITTTPKHVIYHEKRGEDNYIGVADSETGEVLSVISAYPYTLFRGAPTSGVFYAIDKTGAVLALADREVAEALQREKYAQ